MHRDRPWIERTTSCVAGRIVTTKARHTQSVKTVFSSIKTSPFESCPSLSLCVCTLETQVSSSPEWSGAVRSCREFSDHVRKLERTVPDCPGGPKGYWRDDVHVNGQFYIM